MPTVFDALYSAALPFFLPPLVYRRIALKKYRESLPGMLGRGLPSSVQDSASAAPKYASAQSLGASPPSAIAPCRAWLHAVSVGEVVAAAAVLRRLNARHPQWHYMASTVTETGQAHAQKMLREAKEIFYYPLDFSRIVRRFLDHYRPDFIIIHETELWPNFLCECGRRAIPVFLANGTVSPESAQWYRRGRVLFRRPLAAFRAFCMQTAEEAERIRGMGVAENLIHVTGNCKFDALGQPLSPEERREELARIGWPADARVVVAGSTHPGEEEIVLAGFRALREKFPDARLVLAPRHPERFNAVAELLERQQWSYLRASAPQAAAQLSSAPLAASPSTSSVAAAPSVFLLDAMGRLARIYGLGDVALVCGSWVPIGGHNLLEAAVHAIPVVRGPYMHEQPEIVRILGPKQGGIEARADAIGSTLIELFSNDSRRRELGKLAAEAVARNRGAAERTVDIILNCLSSARS